MPAYGRFGVEITQGKIDDPLGRKAVAGEAIRAQGRPVAPQADGARFNVLDVRIPFGERGRRDIGLAEGLHLDRLAGFPPPADDLIQGRFFDVLQIQIEDDFFPVAVPFQPLLEFRVWQGRNLRGKPARFDFGCFVAPPDLAQRAMKRVLPARTRRQAEGSAHIAHVGELDDPDLVKNPLHLAPAAGAFVRLEDQRAGLMNRDPAGNEGLIDVVVEIRVEQALGRADGIRRIDDDDVEAAFVRGDEHGPVSDLQFEPGIVEHAFADGGHMFSA